jgi:hypothetical protein
MMTEKEVEAWLNPDGESLIQDPFAGLDDKTALKGLWAIGLLDKDETAPKMDKNHDRTDS